MVSFQVVKGESADFNKLHDSLAAYDIMLEKEYVYAYEIESFYEKKYDNDFEVEYLGVGIDTDSREYYVYDVTWKANENMIDLEMFSTFIEKELDEFVAKDDYMRILLETIATQFEIYQHICFDYQCANYVESASKAELTGQPHGQENYLQFIYDTEIGKDEFLGKVVEVERRIQNTVILEGTEIALDIIPSSKGIDLLDNVFSFQIVKGGRTDFDKLYTLLTEYDNKNSKNNVGI